MSVEMSGESTLEAPVTPPSLADHLAAVAGQDPILMGATGYLDDVFTSRLAGDSE